MEKKKRKQKNFMQVFTQQTSQESCYFEAANKVPNITDYSKYLVGKELCDLSLILIVIL